MYIPATYVSQTSACTLTLCTRYYYYYYYFFFFLRIEVHYINNLVNNYNT